MFIFHNRRLCAIFSGNHDLPSDAFKPLEGFMKIITKISLGFFSTAVLRAGFAIITTAIAFDAGAATYTGVAVTILQSPTPTQDCIYFQLAGVSQADPVAPSNPWFAVPSTQNGASGIYAALLSARVAGAPISVTTSGNLAGGSCGAFAGILYLSI
jgi:hypothetical protein